MSIFQKIKSRFKPAASQAPINLTPIVEAIRQASASTDARSLLQGEDSGDQARRRA